MKKAIQIILLISTAGLSVNAFSPYPSSFTGSATSVCSRAELRTELSCPPSSSSLNRHQGRNLGMPPFLKKLGLKKPGSEDKEELSSGNTSVLIKEGEEAKKKKKLQQQLQPLKEKQRMRRNYPKLKNYSKKLKRQELLASSHTHYGN